MRRAFLIALVWLAVPVAALAKPKLAIAPIEGDSGGKVASAIEDALGDDAKLISSKKVARALDDVGASGDLDTKAVKKLAAKLEADVVVSGKVDKDGGNKKLRLRVTLRGKKPAKVEIAFKSPTSDKFKKELRQELTKRLGDAGEPDDDDDDRRKKKRTADDDDDDRRKKKRTTDDDDDDGAVRKKKKRRGDEDDGDGPGVQRPRHPLTQAALHVNAGGAFARRTLTYVTTGMNPPPPVGTAAAAGRIQAELYPAAFSTPKGFAAGLGITADFEKTFGLSIDVPAGTAPINQGRYAIGARYRAVFGAHSVAFGASYWRRQYIADRSQLAMATGLDVPDVDYTAITPGAVVRIGATPKVGVFLALDVPLMLSTGAIQETTSYGSADVIAFEAAGGVDIALGAHYALRFAAEFSQVGFSFNAKPGTMAAARGVTNATDRLLGIAATFAVTY